MARSSLLTIVWQYLACLGQKLVDDSEVYVCLLCQGVQKESAMQV